MKLVDLMPEWVNAGSNHALRRFADSHSHVWYGEGEEWAEPPSLLSYCGTRSHESAIEAA